MTSLLRRHRHHRQGSSAAAASAFFASAVVCCSHSPFTFRQVRGISTTTEEGNARESEEAKDTSTLCRPRLVHPLLRHCAFEDDAPTDNMKQMSEQKLSTNGDILAFLQRALFEGVDVASQNSIDADDAAALFSSAAAVLSPSLSQLTSMSASAVTGLDASADLACWGALTEEEKEGGTADHSLPAFSSYSPSSSFTPRSGAMAMSHVQLEKVHTVLKERLANRMPMTPTTTTKEEEKAPPSMAHHEDDASARSFPFIIGCDEAGRGPLAGPVVCAAYGRLLLKKKISDAENKEGREGRPERYALAPMSDYFVRSPSASSSSALEQPQASSTIDLLPEVVPAMDSKQMPAAVREYSFKALTSGNDLGRAVTRLKECTAGGSSIRGCDRTFITTKASAYGQKEEADEEENREAKKKKGGCTDEQRPLADYFRTVTNPTPFTVMAPPITSKPQEAVRMGEEGLQKVLQQVEKASPTAKRIESSPASAAWCPTSGFSLEGLLRAAVLPDHPPLITTIPFVSVIKVPSSSATTTATRSPISLSNIRTALKAYSAAVKVGEKQLLSEEKKKAKEAIKAAKDAEKQRLKAEKEAAKAASKKGKKSVEEPTKSETDLPSTPLTSTPTSTPLPSSSPSPPPRDWQPEGLHPTLSAVRDAYLAAYTNSRGGDATSPSAASGSSPSSFAYLQIGAVSIVNHQYIDATNILASSVHGMSTAVEGVLSMVGKKANGNADAEGACAKHMQKEKKHVLVFGNDGFPIGKAGNGDNDNDCASKKVAFELDLSGIDSIAPIVLVDGSAAPSDLLKILPSSPSSSFTSFSSSPTSAAVAAAVAAAGAAVLKAVVPITKGDSTSYSIAAASTLAKTTRDAIMTYYGRPVEKKEKGGDAAAGNTTGADEGTTAFPQYGFADHEGYPCPTHREAIARHGLSPIHRRTYGPCRAVLLAAQMRK